MKEEMCVVLFLQRWVAVSWGTEIGSAPKNLLGTSVRLGPIDYYKSTTLALVVHAVPAVHTPGLPVAFLVPSF